MTFILGVNYTKSTIACFFPALNRFQLVELDKLNRNRFLMESLSHFSQVFSVSTIKILSLDLLRARETKNLIEITLFFYFVRCVSKIVLYSADCFSLMRLRWMSHRTFIGFPATRICVSKFVMEKFVIGFAVSHSHCVLAASARDAIESNK